MPSNHDETADHLARDAGVPIDAVAPDDGGRGAGMSGNLTGGASDAPVNDEPDTADTGAPATGDRPPRVPGAGLLPPG